MSVFQNSTPQEDGNILAGTAAVIGDSAVEYNVVSLREDSQVTPQWLELSSGGQFVGVFDRNGTYLETGDTGFSFRWKFWARGSGTVALTQDTDPLWDTSTLPSTSIGNLVVSAVDWTVYHVATDPIDLTGFLAYDGIRLGLSLTSGTVDITTIQLECVPDGTISGWWRNEAPATDEDPDPVDAVGTIREADASSGYAVDGLTYATRQESWDAALADLQAQDLLGDPGVAGSPDTLLNMFISDRAYIDTVPDSPDDVFGTTFTAGVQKMGVHDTSGSPTPSGTEGVDFIRIPGYTIYDSEPYVRDAANRNNYSRPWQEWDDPYIVLWRDLSILAEGLYADIGLKVWVWLLDGYVNVSVVENSWIPDGSPDWVITPGDPDELVVESVTLPTEGGFTLYAVAGSASLDIDDVPVLPDPGAEVGVFFGGGVWLQSGSDATVGDHPGVQYLRHYGAYSVWDPNATPPGGKLKLRMPDSTWRILGNPADTGGRLKLQTPDLTWWKEYRTTDGAVTTHPLKLYTSDGWLIVDYLTPD